MSVPESPEPLRAEAVEYVRDGLHLRGDRWCGPGWEAHPDVLMLHGGGQTRHSWKHTGARLAARGFRVVALDTRGHGDSDWAADGDYSLSVLGADARAVLAELGRPAIIIGASLGGLTGLEVAGSDTAGQLVALVLADIVPNYEPAGAERIRSFMSSGAAGFDSLEQAADAIAAYLPHRTRPRSAEGLRRNLRQRDDGRWYWHWDPRMMGDPVGRDDHDALTATAQGLRIPLLLIHGAKSDVVTDDQIAAFRAQVPQVAVVRLPNAAHTAAGDDNDGFAAAVIDFVTAR